MLHKHLTDVREQWIRARARSGYFFTFVGDWRPHAAQPPGTTWRGLAQGLANDSTNNPELEPC
eukprot:365783-Chlamydomonas_euryale.AAC.1